MGWRDIIPVTMLRRHVTAATTMTLRDQYLYVTCASSFSVTLPNVAKARDLEFTIIGESVTAGQTITITATGATGWTDMKITATGQALTVKSTGKKWVLQANTGSGNVAAVKTAKLTIGWHDATGTDFKTTSAANTTEQVVDLGAIIPANARIIGACAITTEAWSTSTMVMEIGTTSSGNELVSSATVKAAAASIGSAAGGAFLGSINAAAQNVYCAMTPGANWSTLTTGKTTVLVTYLDQQAML